MSDENSRIVPNKKDIVTVKVNNQNEKKQKHLILCDVLKIFMHSSKKFIHSQLANQNSLNLK